MSAQSSVSLDDHTLSVVLATAFALIDQFSISISGSSHQSSAPASEDPMSSTPSPLPLLSASVSSLKAHSTKLSLLTLTLPFTPSALSSVLSTLNSSVLPSMLTAALLVTNSQRAYPLSFVAEVRSLVKATLRDLSSLISCLERRNKDGDPTSQLNGQQKSEVTEAVGRVWEVCDELVALADGGIGAFVVKKAELWLGLIKDAVEELGEWDPEEDGVDGLFGDDAQQNDNAGEEGEEASELIEKAKAGTMKVLTRVPQSLHVVVKQRLRKINWDVTDSTGPTGTKPSDNAMSSSTDQDGDGRAAQDATVDHVLRGMQHVSETVDEMAEALYMGQLNRSGKLVKDVWKATVEVVESVMSPLKAHPKNGNVNGIGEEQAEKAEDKYIRRALDWIKVVEPKSSVSGTVASGPFQEIKHG